MKGSIYHRPDCPWCAKGKKKISDHPGWVISLYLPYLEKKYWKVTGPQRGAGFKNQAEAFKYLLDIQHFINSEQYYPPPYLTHEGNKFLFSVRYEEYKRNSKRIYRNLLSAAEKHFSPIWDKPIQEIDRIEVDRLLKNLTLKPGYRNVVQSVFHKVLSDAWREGLIQQVPPFPHRAKLSKTAKVWLTREEQDAVLRCIPKESYLFFLFIARHGLRFSEALALTWDRFDFHNRAVTYYASKTDKENQIPLHSEFLAALQTIPINSKNLAFSQIKNEHANKILARACAEAGVKKVTSHEFGRHSFWSQKVHLGFTDEHIALITDNLSAAKSYKHSNLELKRRVIEAL